MVHVDPRDSAPHDFGKKIPAGDSIVVKREFNADFQSDIDEFWKDPLHRRSLPGLFPRNGARGVVDGR